MIDDNVEWAIYGPIDMFPFLGSRHGKAAVLEVCRQIADNVRIHRFDRESIMLGVDSAASMIRYSLTAIDSNKPMSLRLAFRAVQGGAAVEHPRADRHLRSGRAGARASDPPAEDRVVKPALCGLVSRTQRSVKLLRNGALQSRGRHERRRLVRSRLCGAA